MAEVITLDPDAVSVNRTALEINSGAIQVRQEGVDWGNAEIEAVMADQERGSSPVDYRLPNRSITIPLRIKPAGTITFDQARAQLQQKVALLQREGGWLGRTLSSGGTVYADVVNAGLTLGGDWLQAEKDIDINAELRLEVIPDFYEDEIALSDHTETTLPELTFTESNVRGDYPARVRILVDEDDAEDQASLIWCVRSRHYSADASAASAYQAEALEPLDAAAGTAVSGASGGTAVVHSTLAEDWTPVVGTNIGGTTFLTHTGVYRVYARFYSYGGTTDARFVWDVGDLITPTENDPVTIPSTTGFYLLDLGEARLDKVQTGTHRWGGQIQAKGGGTVAVDRIWFFNVDEGFGIAQASPSATTLTPFVARDGFDQTSGTLTGKALPIGGTWAGAGDADSFVLNTTNHTAQRTATSDSAGLSNGRFSIAGTATYAEVSAQADFKFTASAVGVEFTTGVLARYTDTSNFALAHISAVEAAASYLDWKLSLTTVVGGTIAVASTLTSPYLGVPNIYHRVRLVVDTRGNYQVLWGLPDYNLEPKPLLSGYSPHLATGGGLASGKVGFYDWVEGAAPATRQVDNFLITSPEPDAAVFASRTTELSTWNITRENSAGDAYGPTSRVTGDLPRLPAKGIDGRISEVMVKLSRGNLGDSPDGGIDDLSAQAYYRPSWLFVPE